MDAAASTPSSCWARAGWGGDPAVRKGRPPKYGSEVVEVLWRIWKVSEQPCGKRLVEMLGLWLPHYEAEHGKLAPKVRKQLKAISAAQVDRLPAPRKAQCKHRGRSGTKPGSLLKHHIPIRTDNRDITRPGWLEAGTVAHRGGSLEGDFIWSVTYTDIFSGWTSLRAVWNKGAHGVVEATREVEAALPFQIEGFDCDNGHVEQKNWTHVRQLPGYERLADSEMVKEINMLCRELWEPLHNHFCASTKLVSKYRHGAKVIRRHERPMTPCDRLLASDAVSAWKKAELRAVRKALNPFELNRRLEAALR
ncbi:MAG: hypothetical protein JNM65_11595, partial [Verrucomicrobiaceae bacterium]|nr:hypothetical protein [Verrucomicrobiaceae bacterium]